MGGTGDFDWEALPSASVRAFARALSGAGAISDAKALTVLRAQVPVPDVELLVRPSIWSAAVAHWLPKDGVALKSVRDAVARVKPWAPMKGTSHQALAWLGKQRHNDVVQEAVLDALLAAGRKVGLPPETAHLQSYLEVSCAGDAPSELFPYQREIVAEVRNRQAGDLHGLIVMPTGSGKTRTAVTWLVTDQLSRGRRVLWVTHRQELLEQAALTFIRTAPLLKGHKKSSFRMRLLGGGYGPGTTAAEDDHEVAIATIGSLYRNMPAVEQLLRTRDVVVVIDEAHHSTARTWRRIVSTARAHHRPVIGLTATPTRMAEVERRDLSGLYGETLLAQCDMASLIKAGFLAEPRIMGVATNVAADLGLSAADRGYLKKYGEISPNLAKKLARSVPRNKVIVQTWLKGPQDGGGFGQTIVFATNQDHAMTLAEKFTAAGVKADWIAYNRPGRQQVLDAFRSGKLQVLVNVEILTEGVDLPKVETVFLCRPTHSDVLMSQMVGRGMRGTAVGGTDHVHLVSFHDHWRDFDHWMDPVELFPATITEPLPPRPGEPTVSVELDLELIRLAAQEAEDRWPMRVGDVYSSVPAAWYSFEEEVEQADGEIETRGHTVFVARHQLAGFDALEQAARTGQLPVDGPVLAERFFGSTAEPWPAPHYLELLARYANANGSLPPRTSSEVRAQINPRLLAQRMIEDDLGPSGQLVLIDKAAALAPYLVANFWGGIEGFRAEVFRHYADRVNYGRWSIDIERDCPYVRPGNQLEFAWGTGARDLEAVYDEVANDPLLFPHPLPRPTDGIHWGPRPDSNWGLYQFDREADVQRITISPLLDSEEAPLWVLRAVIHHELLHHQDALVVRRV